jgi:hypothetical protein
MSSELIDYENMEKPRYPFVAFLATRNKGVKGKEFKDVFFFNLESSAGTYANVQKYEMKGWPILGYGNLLRNDGIGGISTAENMVDEHTQIRNHIDNQLAMRKMAREDLKREMEAAERTRPASLEERLQRSAKAAEKKAADA